MISGNVMRAGVLLASAWTVVAARADEQPPRAELLVFGSIEARAFDDDPPHEFDDVLPAADFLGSWHSGRWHALAEALLSTEEQEFERLQFGWEPVPDTFVWIGRFHQSASYWNTREHHGQYLQPSITRPAIEDWEDNGGVLPQHVEGLLFETRQPLGEKRGIEFSAGVGISAELHDDALEPFEIFDPRDDNRMPSYSLQFALLPDMTGDDAFGVIASHNELPFDPAPRPDGSDHVDLQVFGVYADVTRGPWQLTSAIYAAEAEFSGAADAPEDRFLAGYFQLQRHFDSRLTALVRIEATDGTGDSAYLALFPGFVKSRNVFDLRWDFRSRQALSIEFADTKMPLADYSEFRLQWSTALP